MRLCICGKTIPRRKERGQREKEYCSVAYRQRAYRERNKGKHSLSRSIEKANERMWDSMFQAIHHESWQDDLERKDELIRLFLSQLENADQREEDTKTYIAMLDRTIERLNDRLAEKEAEIVRLNILLDAQAKKRK